MTPEQSLSQADSRITPISAMALSVAYGALPAVFVSLVGSFFWGAWSLLSFIVFPTLLYSEFVYRHRMADGVHSFVFTYYDLRAESRHKTFLDRCMSEFNDPDHIRAAFRAIAVINPKLGWIYTEKLVRRASSQPRNQKWLLLREIPIFLEDRPEDEIERELTSLRKALGQIGVDIMLSPDPLSVNPEGNAARDFIARREIYGGLKHDLNIDFRAEGELFAHSISLSRAVEVMETSDEDLEDELTARAIPEVLERQTTAIAESVAVEKVGPERSRKVVDVRSVLQSIQKAEAARAAAESNSILAQ